MSHIYERNINVSCRTREWVMSQIASHFRTKLHHTGGRWIARMHVRGIAWRHRYVPHATLCNICIARISVTRMTWMFFIHNTNPIKVASCPLSNMIEKIENQNKLNKQCCVLICVVKMWVGESRVRGRRGFGALLTQIWAQEWYVFSKGKKLWYMWERIWYMFFPWKKIKFDTYERVVCFLGKISSVRQRALYSDDCNRLQQTATERRLIFATKSLVFRWLQQTATDCNRLQQKEGSSLFERALYSEEKELNTSSDDQSATDCNRKGPAIPPTEKPLPCVRSLVSIYPCIYLPMRLCMYARMCVLMYSRVYASTCVSMYLCIYLSIYL